MNNGDGTFQPAVSYETGFGCISVTASDFDADGDNDLAATIISTANVSVLRNNGDGTFQPAENHSVGGGPPSVFAVDLDGDGAIDLASANGFSDVVSVLRNDGRGTFQDPVNFGVGTQPISIFGADLDGDGDIDLATANALSDNVSILLNQTSPTGVEDPPLFPRDYLLFQNYPNPFNARTTIGYFLPEQTMVSIDIFDILGHKIETFVEGIKSGGEHLAIWDAGSHPSGVYFYGIKAGGKTEMKKMVLMR
jgi:hypothetical protein